MTKKRLSIAESVVAQANARAVRARQNVIHYAEHSITADKSSQAGELHSRIDDSPDPQTGEPRLLLTFPGKNQPEIYDFSMLLVQPAIGRFLVEGFRHWTASISPLSRKNNALNLRRYIGDFLKTLQAPHQLPDIDETFWTSFLTWVNGPRRKDGQPWAEASRARIHGTFFMCIEALLEHPKWASEADYLLNHSGFPRKPWLGRSRKVVPRKVLSKPEREAIIVACLSELSELRHRLDENDEKLERGKTILETANRKGEAPPYREEIGVCAARILEIFPTTFASTNDLHSKDSSLGAAVAYKHTLLEVRRLIYATFRDLVPFVLLIGMKTAFNAETILSLNWSRVRLSGDGRKVTFLGTKGRASSLQVSIDNGESLAADLEVPSEPGVPFGLDDLLKLLQRLTNATKSLLADPDQADRLFIGVPKRGTKAKALYIAPGDAGGALWWGVLQDFIATHGLTPFGLSTLRLTEGEMEWRRTGDLLAVRDRLGNKSIATTRTHYTSGGMRRDSQERVAEVQTLYHRWSRSEGRIDPRTQSEPWRSSATPGFGCMQPYDSPRLGQRKGRLCDAYGECPDCPMAQSWPQDVQAAAYYIALEKAIYDARLGRVTARQWAEKWPRVLLSLNDLQAFIPPAIREEASRFRIFLKPVG